MHRCAAYEKGGPAAEARFEAGVAGFEARAFRGCGIMTSEPFEVSDDQDSVQMLTRNSQIGEFYVLQPPQVPPEEGKEKFTCDILIYGARFPCLPNSHHATLTPSLPCCCADEESDRHVRITWGQALDACCIGTGTDKVAEATPMSHPTGKMGGTNTLTNWLLEARKIQAFNEQKDITNKAGTVIFS